MSACGSTVNYNPATNSDTTAPGVNLLITRAGQPSLEVQEQTLPVQRLAGTFPDSLFNTRQTFGVLATATDHESGIRDMKLTLTRTVCFLSSSGAIAQAYSGTVTRKQVAFNQNSAPTQASLGDTGVIDNSATGATSMNTENLLFWTDSNQNLRAGVGVSTRWNMEARNWAGQTVYSNSIVIWAGNMGCGTPP